MCEITQQESDFLDAMVNGICNHYDEWLNKAYRWPQNRNAKDEQSTVLIFNEHSKHLRRGYIEESIFNIFYWGGGDRAIANIAERNEFSDAIKALNLLQNEHPSLDTVLMMGNHPRHGYTRISFWSKVLAAYKPGDFYIYDSRVALALVYISLTLRQPCLWSIPQDAGNMMDQTFKGMNITVQNAVGRNLRNYHGEISVPISYRLYLELLSRLANKKDILDRYNYLSTSIKSAYNKMFAFIPDRKERKNKSIMAHLEKMLFMMKEDILV